MPRLFVFFCFLQSCGGIAFHDQICKTIYFHRLATMRWRGVGLQGWGVHPWLHEVRIPSCLVCTFCHIHPSPTLWIKDNLKDRPTSYSVLIHTHRCDGSIQCSDLSDEAHCNRCQVAKLWREGVVNVLSQFLFFFVSQWFYSQAVSNSGVEIMPK